MLYICRCLYCHLLKQKKYVFKHMDQQDDIRIGNYFSIASHICFLGKEMSMNIKALKACFLLTSVYTIILSRACVAMTFMLA